MLIVAFFTYLINVGLNSHKQRDPYLPKEECESSNNIKAQKNFKSGRKENNTWELAKKISHSSKCEVLKKITKQKSDKKKRV